MSVVVKKFYPTGSNKFKPSGNRVINIPIYHDNGELDTSRSRLSLKISGIPSSTCWIKSVYSLFKRIRVLNNEGQPLEDIYNYGGIANKYIENFNIPNPDFMTVFPANVFTSKTFNMEIFLSHIFTITTKTNGDFWPLHSSGKIILELVLKDTPKDIFICGDTSMGWDDLLIDKVFYNATIVERKEEERKEEHLFIEGDTYSIEEMFANSLIETTEEFYKEHIKLKNIGIIYRENTQRFRGDYEDGEIIKNVWDVPAPLKITNDNLGKGFVLLVINLITVYAIDTTAKTTVIKRK